MNKSVKLNVKLFKMTNLMQNNKTQTIFGQKYGIVNVSKCLKTKKKKLLLKSCHIFFCFF